MSGSANRCGRPRVFVPALLALLAAVVSATSAFAQATAPHRRTGGRVETAECARCHERKHEQLVSRGHGVVLQAAVLPGCEVCHGPGQAHATDKDNDVRLITLPPLLSAADQAALCATCHDDQIARHGGDPRGFLIAGLACTDCHSVHGRPRDPEAPGLRLVRRDEVAAHAEAVGSAECVKCHPLRDSLLAASAHASLAASNDPNGCETCHGEGSLHSANGEGRLVTRPDRAQDGIATCRSCHPEVDAVEFHWRGRDKPYFSTGLTCTSCHVVHAAATPEATPVVADEPATNRLCATCHASAFATMPGSTHQSLGTLDAALNTGCAACHVGAEAHARSGGDRSLLAPWRDRPDHQAELCLSCHAGDRTLEHVRHGDHLRHGVSCTDCHGPLHGARHGEVVERAEQRCASCHPQVAAEFRLPNHHPVPEGRMQCVSCHDVHGARKRGHDLALTERTCVKCHAAYGKPMLFAHEAGRREGCVVCHSPHGATNRRMLHQPTTQQNCLQCHGDFPAFHDQTPGAVFTNCAGCHTEVHGSNHSRYLFR